MIKICAGLMMFRRNASHGLEVLLSHPGGPLYVNKDDGYWGIPKGHVEPNETIFAAACREFAEETGLAPTVDTLLPLGMVTERTGKVIHVWTFQGDCDTRLPVNSNLFAMEWPRHSGKTQFFPEVDRLAFFDTHTARQKIEPAQRQFIWRLETIMGGKANRPIA